MNVKIINAMRSAKKAWEISRPLDNNTPVEEIIKLDLPVSEFDVFHVVFTAPIFIREIFATDRKHIMWAQTSRVENVLEFTIDDDFYHVPGIGPDLKRFADEKRSLMEFNSRKMRQDDYRLDLPIFSNTTFSLVLSRRDYVRYMLWFREMAIESIENRIANRAFYLAFVCMLSELNLSDEEAGVDLRKTIEYKIPNYMDSKMNPIGEFGDYKSIQFKIPMYLRAQLVRHRNIEVYKDNFIDVFVNSDMGHLKTIRDEITANVIASKKTLSEIAEKRNCWVAQYSIWKDFLLQIEFSLPCDCGHCPFEKDVMLRVDGLDPNPPCPIFLRKKNLLASDETKDKIIKMIDDDNRDKKFWTTYLEN